MLAHHAIRLLKKNKEAENLVEHALLSSLSFEIILHPSSYAPGTPVIRIN